MAKKKTPQNDLSDPSVVSGQTLRLRAEERLKKQSPAQGAKTPEETSRLLHELEVHQIELEMQNEELRRAQEELEASRARYFDLYDLAPVGYLTLGEQGLILEANLTAAQMLGVERGRLTGQPVSRFIFRDDQDIYYLSRKQLFERQTPLTIELRLVGDDGKPFWVQMTAKLAQDSDGALVWRATLSDITERKQAEEMLRQSEEKYRLLFQNMAEGFALYELLYNEQGKPADWRILEVNDAYSRHTGLTLEQIVGRRISEIFPEAIPEYLPCFAKVVTDQTSVDFETFAKYIGRHQHVVTFPAGGRRFANIITDITERKRVESVVQARLRMLTAANKITMPMDEFLQLALDEIEAQTGSTIGFYHFLEADQETLSLQSWSTNTLRNLCTAEGKGSHYPISEAGVWVDCVRERRPVIHNDFSSLPHRKGLPQGHAPVTREMVVPIMRDSRVVAIIGVGNRPSNYGETDVDIALLLGDFSWEIVERKRAEQALQERTRELVKLSSTLELQVRERTAKLAKANDETRRISGKLLSAQEEERKRIAGEIHDTLGSNLTAISFKVEDTLQKHGNTPTVAAEYLEPLIPLIQESIEDCRRIQADLRPPMLDDLGLLSTLSWFFRRFKSIYSTIQVEQEIGIEEEDVPIPLKIVVFRVTQETMNNIAKYSQADLVRQSLQKQDGRMKLVIQDNGQGFNLEEIRSSNRPRKGLGITSMKERVELSGGLFAIESSEGKGTIIRAEWPIGE
jgi:PAS domain S-box-containing protein